MVVSLKTQPIVFAAIKDDVAAIRTLVGAGANPDQIRFEIPKNFTVTADTSGRGLVLLILNHRLQNQEGYALSPDAAKQVAGGLTKSAEAVLALKPPAPPLN